ncbi:MAG: hypothetical protein NTY77_04830 [Elusimicrobia bacterium]|nr:hypothetical protein [Elusimicrobiota bacterium]
MYKNAALTYLLGLLALVIGSLIVHYHDIWVGDWPVLITVLGWIAVVKGIMIIAFPNAMQRLTRRLLAGAAPRIVPYFALSLGLLFGYLGFVR